MGILALAAVVAASIIIWKACDYFEAGSSYLGRNMPPGVRGATINATGSSLPELLTTFCLLFLFKDQDGYSAGIATCAGSAVFNMVIIPAVVLVAVVGKKVAPHIELTRSVILRDGFFFLVAELALIYFLSDSTLSGWMGLALIGIYVLYFGYMMREVSQHEADEEDDDEEEMTTGKAWRYLATSAMVIGGACYGLSWAVIELAEVWEVPAFLTAVIFGAAATSVPDTMLSVKDALNGEYDDAVSNAVGSNIFDITICLGLPLLCYGVIYGDVHVSAVGTAADVQSLRIGLIVATIAVLSMFLMSRKLKMKHGYALIGIFCVWLGFLYSTGLA